VITQTKLYDGIIPLQHEAQPTTHAHNYITLSTAVHYTNKAFQTSDRLLLLSNIHVCIYKV